MLFIGCEKVYLIYIVSLRSIIPSGNTWILLFTILNVWIQDLKRIDNSPLYREIF